MNREATAPNNAEHVLSEWAQLIQAGDIKRFEAYLNGHPDALRARDADGRTPLHLTIVEGQHEMCNMLLKRGADTSARDNNGQVPLLLALVGDDVVTAERASRERLAREQHWMPREAWRVWHVRSLALVLLVAAWLTLATLPAAVNPRMNVWLRWNSIEHVVPRPRDQSLGIQSLASSGNTLALLDDQGRVGVMNRGTRVWREETAGPYLDVSPGFESGEFLLLDEAGFHRLRTGLLTNTLSPWGPPASFWPVDPGRRREAIPKVVDARMVDEALVVAIEGVGVGRYSTSSSGAARPAWVDSGLRDRPLDQAVITNDRVVYSLRNGGLGIGNLADMSLTSEKSTPPIVRLEADDQRSWAQATDAYDGLWLASRDAQSWNGPFFSREGESVGQTPSVNDLTDVLLHGEIAYLGQADGVSSYSPLRRRVSPLITNQRVDVILPSWNSSGEPDGVLVQNASGVWFADGLERTKRSIDEGVASSLSSSADGQVAAYLLQAGPVSTPAVRVVFAPSSPRPVGTTAAPSVAWRKVAASEFVVHGVVRHNDQFVFATPQGSFLLDPRSRIYTDASRIEIPARGKGNAKRIQTATPMTGLAIVGEHVVASAGGIPVKLRERDSSWLALDSSPDVTLKAFSGTDDHIVGLDATGRLFDFGNGESGEADTYCGGASTILSDLGKHRFPGDVAVGVEGRWRAIFGRSRKLVHYDSKTSDIGEWELPGGDTQYVQVRLDKFGFRLLAKDGRVVNSDGVVVFGPSVMPIDPQSATAIAAAKQPHQLFLGQGRRVVQYDWQRGAVIDHSVGIPLEVGDIRELGLAGDSLLAASDTNQVLVATPSEDRGLTWNSLAGFRQFAVDQSGDRVYLNGDSGIAVLDVPSNTRKAYQPQPQWCGGRGMREFVSNSTYAWKLSGTKTAFFPPQGPLVGVFDTSNQMWQEIAVHDLRPTSTDANATRQFSLSPAGHLAIRNGPRIAVFQAGAAEAQPAILYPLAGLSSASDIRWDGETLLCAYVGPREELRIGQVIPFASGGPPQEWRESFRGGQQAAIDTRDIVFVESLGENRFRLLNARGGVGSYDARLGAWRVERPEVEGQVLQGWFGSSARRLRLLLDSNDGASDLITLGSNFGEFQEIDHVRFPMSAKQLLEGLAQPEKREAPALQDAFRSIAPMLVRDWGVLQSARVADWTLSDGSVRVIRSKEGSRLILRNGGVLETSPQGGFLQDRYSDVAWDREGQVWTLHPLSRSQLGAVSVTPQGLELRPERVQLPRAVVGIDSTATDVVQVEFGDGERRILTRTGASLEFRLIPKETQLVQWDYGKWRLAWIVDESGSVKGRWTNELGALASLPVWDDDTGRLATQVVLQMTLSEDNALLLATPLGLLVRSSETFELLDVRAGFQRVEILQGTDRQRILVFADDQTFVWRDGKLQSAGASTDAFVLDEVHTGPWRWARRRSLGHVSTISVTHSRTNDIRHVGPVGDGWQFLDDRVNWLCRGISDQDDVWLATDAGLWLTDDMGRRDSNVPPRLPGGVLKKVRCIADGDWQWRDSQGRWFTIPSESAETQTVLDTDGEEGMVRRPGLSISYAEGFLTMETEGAALFVDGRFFFDDQTAIQFHAGRLYSIAGNGGWLVARNLGALGNVVGCWSLPPDTPANTPLDLETRDGQLVLRALAQGDRYLAWRIAWRERTPVFTRWEDYEVESLPADVVVWRRTPQGDFRPHLPDANDRYPAFRHASDAESLGLQRINDFWKEDRFAWDAFEDAKLLPNGDLVARTSLGLLWIRPTPTGAPTLGLAPLVEAQDLQPAIDSTGQNCGLLVNVVKDSSFLVQANAEGTPTIERIVDTSPYTNSARLRFEYQGVGEGQSLVLKQYWRGRQELKSIPLLSSEIPGLPDDRLLQAGQFVFDGADAACQVDDRHWMTIRRIPAGAQASRWVRLERLTSQDFLQPVDCWNIDDYGQLPVAIRSERAGDQMVTAWMTSVSSDRAPGCLAMKLKLRTAAPAGGLLPQVDQDRFRAGQVVSWDAEQFTWNATPRPFGSDLSRLVAHPIGFPILVWERDGIQMSFDVHRGVALRKSTDDALEMALATRGGLQLYSLAKGALPAFGKPDRVVFVSDELGVDSDATHVRFVQDTAWVLFGKRRQWRACTTTPQSGTQTGSIPVMAIDGKRIEFPPGGGINVGEQLYSQSNDAWWLGRQPIRKVNDFYFDPEYCELWLSCQGSQLFRVVLDALP